MSDAQSSGGQQQIPSPTPASKLAGDPGSPTPASKLAGDPGSPTPASKLVGDPESPIPASKLVGDPGSGNDRKKSHGGPAENRDRVFRALDSFSIEIPSWGFANTGTRFGKFAQHAAATTIEEKFADAAEVNRLTGATPSLALHVLWDLPHGTKDVPAIQELERRTGIRAGSINPNLFQEPEYKFGSIANPSAAVRAKAAEHMICSVEIGKALGSPEVSLWIADGSNYPGTQSMRRRICWIQEALRDDA